MADTESILIVDDDPEFQQLVEYNLKVAGFKVFQALNGPDGLKIAKKKLPGVILLDTTMPEMDGLEVLGELKQDKKAKEIPVFMLTAKTLMEDIERAFDLGADDYITKPVELNKLAQIVRTKLRKIAQ